MNAPTGRAGFPWPEGFVRVPVDPWTTQPLGELALKYDTVETHGWYENLDPVVASLDAALAPGEVLVDYSGGTGILADRLLRRVGARRIGVILADASPKFLRLALEKLGGDERVAFRWLPWLRDEKRLKRLDEVLDPVFARRGVHALSSTNAIHLYSDLDETLASWARVLVPGGRAFVQSGNIGNPAAEPDEWIIDATVEAIEAAARELVRSDPRWSAWRPVLDDDARLAAHDSHRRKVFLPVRPLEAYVAALERAGFAVTERAARRIDARVDDWHSFLAAYHDAVLGWAGGSEKVEGVAPSDEVVAERVALLRAAMDVVFGGRASFPCCWTYLAAVAP